MNIIDSDNYAEHGIKTFFFPGGEPHARIPKDFGPAVLFLKARTWNNFGIALCVINALMEQGAYVAVFAAYFPGARQDRSDGQTPITADIYLRALGDIDYLCTFDVHSSRAFVPDHNFMPADMGDGVKRPFHVIAPDEGAVDRAQQFARVASLYPDQVIACKKKRDFVTGKFTSFTMPPLPHAGEYAIVDDICDGGGTFNLLAEQFLADPYGPDSKLTMLVSHGIFSRGLDAIHPKISHIVTTDSWCRGPSSERLTVIPLRGLLERSITRLTGVNYV